MSLLNEALKRASTVRALPAEHQGGAPMQPAIETAPRSSGNPVTYAVIGLAALVVITVTGLLLKSKTAHLEEAEPALALATSPAQAALTAAAATPAQALAAGPETIPVEAPPGVTAPAQPVQISTQPVTLPVASAAPAAQTSETIEPSPAANQPVTAPPKVETPVQMAMATTAAQPKSLPADNTAEPVASKPVAEVASQPAPVTRAAATPEASVTTTSTSAPAASAQAEPAQPVVAAAPAKFPELQLQAIHYRLKNPSVMLNGKTLRVGENIQGAKIIAIHRYGVELSWRSEKKFLGLD